jgi:hypothetical protein
MEMSFFDSCPQICLKYSKHNCEKYSWSCAFEPPLKMMTFNPKPCGYINLRCRAARSHILLLRRPIGEREALRHADYWRGECPVRGWWWSDSLKSYKPSQPYEIAKNGKKTGGFAHCFAYKSPKTPFFAILYLTRYTHETFFEEYINFKIFRNLGYCGVIPVRSFGSHIRPQPRGLGLS